MSRKRKKAHKVKTRVEQAVPEEILAEGSGPLVSDEMLADAAAAAEAARDGDVSAPDAEASEAAEAAAERDGSEASLGAEASELGGADDVVATDHAEPILPAELAEDLEAAPAMETLAEGSEAVATDGEVVASADETAHGSSDGEATDASPDVSTDAPTDAPTDALYADAADGEHGDGTDDGEGEGEDGDGEAVEGAALPLAAATMDHAELKKLVEALVFASDKPVTVQRLRQLTRVSDTKRLEATLVELQGDYTERGLILTSVSGGWQFRTQPRFSSWVQQLIAGRPVRLSRAQLETLAIVAYRQPITRPEIDDIRGVDSSATLKLLLDRQLIRVLGKKEEVGRPMLYGTTKEFLDFFSLGDLRELPTLREYSELSDESRRVMSDRLGIDPDADLGATAAAATANVDHDAPAEGSAEVTGDGENIVEAVTHEASVVEAMAVVDADAEAVEATEHAVDAVAAAVDAVADAVHTMEDAAESAVHVAEDASEHVADAAATDAPIEASIDAPIEASIEASPGVEISDVSDDSREPGDAASDSEGLDDAMRADATGDALVDPAFDTSGDLDAAGDQDASAAGAAGDDVDAAAGDAAGMDAVAGEADEAGDGADPDAEVDAELEHDARTLSNLAARILAEDAEREREPRIDVEAMPGIRADADSFEAAGPLMTDDIVDSDVEDAGDPSESE